VDDTPRSQLDIYLYIGHTRIPPSFFREFKSFTLVHLNFILSCITFPLFCWFFVCVCFCLLCFEWNKTKMKLYMMSSWKVEWMRSRVPTDCICNGKLLSMCVRTSVVSGRGRDWRFGCLLEWIRVAVREGSLLQVGKRWLSTDACDGDFVFDRLVVLWGRGEAMTRASVKEFLATFLFKMRAWRRSATECAGVNR